MRRFCVVQNMKNYRIRLGCGLRPFKSTEAWCKVILSATENATSGVEATAHKLFLRPLPVLKLGLRGLPVEVAQANLDRAVATTSR